MKPQRPHPVKRAAYRGFTLSEMAVVIAIIAILASFGFATFSNASEHRDAKLVEATQATLQSVVSQGSARLDVSPSELKQTHSAQILSAVQAAVQTTSNAVNFSDDGGGKFGMTIQSSGRYAQFEIDNNGDVRVSGLGSKFTVYEAKDGFIEKKP